MATEAPEKVRPTTPFKFKPIVLEFDNGKNGTMILPVNTSRIRMRFTRRNFFARRDRHGRETIKSMGKIESMPDIPGMLLAIRPHVDRPGYIECRISDPLKDDPELLERISAVLQNASVIGSDAKRKAAPPESFTMDADTAKTFLLGLCTLVEEGSAKAVEHTTFPSRQEIESMPGREIYDPANPFATRRRYVDDVLSQN